MNLKRIFSVLLFVCCASIFTPVSAAIGDENPATRTGETPKEVLTYQIKTRLLEIKNMDKSTLTKEEKKELKKEVKDLKRKAAVNGIYLSVGALIIIILLLILIL